MGQVNHLLDFGGTLFDKFLPVIQGSSFLFRWNRFHFLFLHDFNLFLFWLDPYRAVSRLLFFGSDFRDFGLFDLITCLLDILELLFESCLDGLTASPAFDSGLILFDLIDQLLPFLDVLLDLTNLLFLSLLGASSPLDQCRCALVSTFKQLNCGVLICSGVTGVISGARIELPVTVLIGMRLGGVF